MKLFILGALFFLHVTSLSAQDISRIFKIDDGLQERRGADAILASVVSEGKLFNLPSATPTPFVSNVYAKVWRGNDVKVNAKIKGARFTFLPPDSEEADKKELPLTVNFTFGEQGLVVQRSDPDNSAHRAGVLLGKRPRQKWRQFYLGRRSPGLAVFVPASASGRQDHLLFCLREMKNVGRAGKRLYKNNLRFIDTKYTLKSAEVKVDGDLSAELLSGGKPGRIKGTILTTANVLPGKANSDELFDLDPYLELDYNPDLLSSIDDSVAADGTVLGGIRLKLEQQTKAGYQRTTTTTKLLSLTPVLVEKSVEAISKVGFIQLGPGLCYALEIFEDMKVDFDKQAFKEPTD